MFQYAVTSNLHSHQQHEQQAAADRNRIQEIKRKFNIPCNSSYTDFSLSSSLNNLCQKQFIHYTISTGEISIGKEPTEAIGVGYSGNKDGYRNNPFLTHVKSKGPIPAGLYKLCKGVAADGQPTTIPLHARCPLLGMLQGHMFGRNGFSIRGSNGSDDDVENCIVMPQNVYEQIIQSEATVFKVYRGGGYLQKNIFNSFRPKLNISNKTPGRDATLWIPSPYHYSGRKGKEPKWIIIHGTGGGASAENIAAGFYDQNAPKPKQKSAHFIVGRDGVVTQCVLEKDSAWANGRVELGADAWWSSGNPNYETISIEHVKPSAVNSEVLSDVQKEVSFHLVREIIGTYPKIRKTWANEHGGITGHYSITPKSRANCPGPYPFEELFEFLEANPCTKF